MRFSSCSLGSVVAARELSCPIACEISLPQPGIKPTSSILEGRFLTTGPPEKFWTLGIIQVDFTEDSGTATSRQRKWHRHWRSCQFARSPSIWNFPGSCFSLAEAILPWPLGDIVSFLKALAKPTKRLVCLPYCDIWAKNRHLFSR